MKVLNLFSEVHFSTEILNSGFIVSATEMGYFKFFLKSNISQLTKNYKSLAISFIQPIHFNRRFISKMHRLLKSTLEYFQPDLLFVDNGFPLFKQALMQAETASIPVVLHFSTDEDLNNQLQLIDFEKFQILSIWTSNSNIFQQLLYTDIPTPLVNGYGDLTGLTGDFYTLSGHIKHWIEQSQKYYELNKTLRPNLFQKTSMTVNQNMGLQRLFSQIPIIQGSQEWEIHGLPLFLSFTQTQSDWVSLIELFALITVRCEQASLVLVCHCVQPNEQEMFFESLQNLLESRNQTELDITVLFESELSDLQGIFQKSDYLLISSQSIFLEKIFWCLDAGLKVCSFNQELNNMLEKYQHLLMTELMEAPQIIGSSFPNAQWWKAAPQIIYRWNKWVFEQSLTALKDIGN